MIMIISTYNTFINNLNVKQNNLKLLQQPQLNNSWNNPSIKIKNERELYLQGVKLWTIAVGKVEKIFTIFAAFVLDIIKLINNELKFITKK